MDWRDSKTQKYTKTLSREKGDNWLNRETGGKTEIQREKETTERDTHTQTDRQIETERKRERQTDI